MFYPLLISLIGLSFTRILFIGSGNDLAITNSINYYSIIWIKSSSVLLISISVGWGSEGSVVKLSSSYRFSPSIVEFSFLAPFSLNYLTLYTY